MLLKSLAIVAVAAVLAIAPVSGAAAESLDREVAAEIDRFAAHIVETWPLPGVAIAIVNRQGTLHAAGFGVTGDTPGNPVDADTLFLINSMTKSMSAAAAGALVDQGRLSWSDPVKRHLPWFQVADPVVTGMLSIEDALVHRTGVECNDWLEDLPGMTWDEGLRRHRFLGQSTSFRTRYSYCNWTFSLAGRVAAEIDGGWAATLDRRLFVPLGMSRSVPIFSSAIAPEALTACHECELVQTYHGPELRPGFRNIAMPHVDQDGHLVRSPWRNSAALAAGSVLSSAHDLARYAQMLLDDGNYEGRRVLSERTVEELFKPRIPQDPGVFYARLSGFEAEADRVRDLSVAYGYGWELGEYAGLRAAHHGGGSLGFASNVVLLPEKGLGVIVLTNYNDRKSGGVDVLTFGILDRLLGLQPGKWQQFQAELQSMGAAQDGAEQPVLKTAANDQTRPVPASLLGAYCHPAYGRANVVRDGSGGLQLNQGPERRGRLSPLAGDVFSLRWNGPRNDPKPVQLEAGGNRLQIGDGDDAVTFNRCVSPSAK